MNKTPQYTVAGFFIWTTLHSLMQTACAGAYACLMCKEKVRLKTKKT
jgi:hypothetical protein